MQCENIFLIEYFDNCNGDYVVYTNSTYVEELRGVDIVKNYNGQILYTDISNFEKILNNVDAVASEKLLLYDTNLEYIDSILGIEILEEVVVNDDIVLYNCYTSKLNRKVSSRYGYMNIQIAINNDSILIGYPYLVDY